MGRPLSTGPKRTGLAESSHVNVALDFLHFAGDPARFPEAVGYRCSDPDGSPAGRDLVGTGLGLAGPWLGRGELQQDKRSTRRVPSGTKQQ